MADLERCRCEALRLAFAGFDPPTCALCVLNHAVVQLESEGWVRTNGLHRLAYEDCGVELKTLGHLGDGSTWVVGWAKTIVDVLHVPGVEGGYCGPVIKRAVTDCTFREAVEAILRVVSLTEWPTRGDGVAIARQRINAFAASQGLTPLAPVSQSSDST